MSDCTDCNKLLIALKKAKQYLDENSCNDDEDAPDPECVVCVVNTAIAEFEFTKLESDVPPVGPDGSR